MYECDVECGIKRQPNNVAGVFVSEKLVVGIKDQQREWPIMAENGF